MDSVQVVVGIDIGGTKMAAAAVTSEGIILARHAQPTEAGRGFADGLRRMVALIERVLSEAGCAGADLAAVGIGCAGPVDPLRGTIDNPYTLPTWDGVDVVGPLQARFGVPVGLENDADAAALGEYWLGAGQGARILTMVTVGTGIGGGVIVDGRVYRGAGGGHPEIGHLGIDPQGPACYCGMRGCWESLASGPAMAARLLDRAPGLDRDTLTGAEVVRRARGGDPAAMAVVAEMAAIHARGVVTLLNLYLPDALILGGGVMEAYDLFAPSIQTLAAADTMAPRGTEAIRPAALGNDAGLLGAARLALNLGPERQSGSGMSGCP